ncbi:uncharacterized protein LOC143158072 [Aptenodytes patagonicus]|uniref:uncharacterized protein LOC143158072 n=1 Tax=Aptenodytes patagonicus TaxID=9234 RepID=UPI003FA02F62
MSLENQCDGTGSRSKGQAGVVASINKELEQTHPGHRKGWLKIYIHPIQTGYSDIGIEAAKIKKIWHLNTQGRTVDYTQTWKIIVPPVQSQISGVLAVPSAFPAGHVEKRRKMNYLAMQGQHKTN